MSRARHAGNEEHRSQVPRLRLPGQPGLSNEPRGRVQLHGAVVNANGYAVQGVDLGVVKATTGVPIPLCNDKTNASGP